MNKMEEILQGAKKIGPKAVAVAVAEDSEVMRAVEDARAEGIVTGILFGNKEKILRVLKEINADPANYEIADAQSNEEACKMAVAAVKEKKATTVMKGKVDTSVILKAIINKEHGLGSGGLISHVGVLKVDKFDKFFLLSDSAVNIMPTFDDLVKIVENAVAVAHALDIENPKVAMICPVEKVNPKIESTINAAKLVEMNLAGTVTGCIIGGPFALDNAVSMEAAKSKGIDHPVAGQADIFIVPNLEVGNVLIKSMEYFANTEKAGILMGAGVPLILTSRASTSISKLNSIALAVLVANKMSAK
jgi:phosphate butyryltransferase